MGGVENPEYKEPPLKISGDADHYEQKRGVEDDYIQPGNLFRLMNNEQKEYLFKEIAGTLKKVSEDIQKRMLKHFYKADKEYGEGVEKALNK